MWRLSLVFLGLAQVLGLSTSLQVEHLESSLLSLAEVLRHDHQGDEHAARQKLKEKADEMKEEDVDAAGLLGQLAHQGLAKSDQDGAEGSQVLSRSSFTESELATDGKGHFYEIRHVKNCKNGACEEHTEKTSPQALRGKGNKITKAVNQSVAFTADALDREIGKLQKQMQSMERRIKFPDFNDVFAPVGENFWRHFRSMGNIGNLSNHTGSVSHSESVSDKTVLRNGHAVHLVKRCKDGKCYLTVEQGNLA